MRHLRGFKSLDVTVVDPKEYFEYTPGVPHLLAGSHGDLLSPLPALAARCGATRVLCGRFMGVDAAGKRVAVATGAPGAVEVLPYDALVVCSGMPYAAPIGHAAGSTPLTLEHRLKDLAAYTERLSGSKHVIVAGGGLVGVELAAELSVRLQGKVQQVTLIARSSLLATLPAAAGRHALAWLQGRKNVRVLLNDEVVGCDNPVMADGGVYKTKSGQELHADMYIDCTGAGGSNSSSSSSHRAGALAAAAPQGFLWPLNARGLLRVDERLQATDLSPAAAVFAAGDVLEHAPGAGFACTTPRAPYGTLTSNPAVRNAHLAESQAELVGHNVAALLGVSAGPPHFHAYPRDLFGAELCPLVACVSLGTCVPRRVASILDSRAALMPPPPPPPPHTHTHTHALFCITTCKVRTPVS